MNCSTVRQCTGSLSLLFQTQVCVLFPCRIRTVSLSTLLYSTLLYIRVRVGTRYHHNMRGTESRATYSSESCSAVGL